jgi:transcriptional regulator with XRE-family HTH domain
MSNESNRKQMVTRIGELIKQRRTEIGLSRPKFAELSGISSLTSVQNAEIGSHAPNELNQRKFEAALDWAPGAIRRALDKVGEMDASELTMEFMDGERQVRRGPALADASFDDLLAELSRRYRAEVARASRLPEQPDFDLAASDDMTGGDDGH